MIFKNLLTVINNYFKNFSEMMEIFQDSKFWKFRDDEIVKKTKNRSETIKICQNLSSEMIDLENKKHFRDDKIS